MLMDIRCITIVNVNDTLVVIGGEIIMMIKTFYAYTTRIVQLLNEQIGTVKSWVDKMMGDVKLNTHGLVSK